MICGNGREWNQDKLARLFTDEVRSRINELTPAGKNSKDTYAWEYTKSGHFTVKSAYWVQVNVLAVEQEAQMVLQPSFDGLYQKIWSSNTSPKVKHFLWRCLSNSLPVAENMAYCHLAKDKTCARCGVGEESVNHLFFQCTYARQLWALAHIHIPPSGTWSDSFYANLYWVLNHKKVYPREEVDEELVSWLMWRIWKNRNEFIFRGVDFNAPATIMKVWDDVQEWKNRAEVKNEVVKKQTMEGPVKKWLPPAPSWIKCNTDGS